MPLALVQVAERRLPALAAGAGGEHAGQDNVTSTSDSGLAKKLMFVNY